MIIDLSPKKSQRRLSVLRVCLLACQEMAGSKVEFQTLLQKACWYGSELDQPVTEGEAESVLVLLLVHFKLSGRAV